MIQTVKINDETTAGKRIINDLRKHPKEVFFENTVPSGKIREGYFTLDEFRKIAIEKGHKFCDNHDII
jgi:hypothetical protein